jgi:hypothetical protein
MVDFIGQVFTNSSGREYEVIALDPVRRNKKKIYHVRFKESGYVTTAAKGEIRSGLIRDKLEPTIYGVASLGNASSKHPAYGRWFGMVRRCYDTEHVGYHNYGGAGITVCNRWLRFDNFLEDLSSIEGYDKEGFESGDLHLDKDIKQQHLPKEERTYSLETCMFVSKKDNDQVRVNNEHLKHQFKAISPDGEVIMANGIKAFAREYGLNHASVANRLRENSQKPYRGWVLCAV